MVYTRTSSDTVDAKTSEPTKQVQRVGSSATQPKKRDPSKPCIVCKATFCTSKTCRAERKRIREIRRAKRAAKTESSKKVIFAAGSGGSTSVGGPQVVKIVPVAKQAEAKPPAKVTVYQIKLSKPEPKPDPPKRVAVEVVSSSSSVTVEAGKAALVYQPAKATKEHVCHDHRPAEPVCHCKNKVDHSCQAKSHQWVSAPCSPPGVSNRPIELVLQTVPETCHCKDKVEHACRAKHHHSHVAACGDAGLASSRPERVVELTVCKCGQVKSGCKCVTVHPARQCMGKCPIGHCTCVELQLTEQKRHDHGPKMPLANCRCGRFGGSGCTCGIEGLIQMQMAQCGMPCGPTVQGGLPIVFAGAVGLGCQPGLIGQPSVMISAIGSTVLAGSNPPAKIAIAGVAPGSTVTVSLVTTNPFTGMQTTASQLATVGVDGTFMVSIPGTTGPTSVPQHTLVSVTAINGLQVASNTIDYTVA